MNCNLKFFEDKINNLTAEYQELSKKSTSLSVLRFVVFFLLIVPCIVMIFVSSNKILWGIGAFIFVAGFVVLCTVHNKVNKRTELTKNLIDINREYAARINVDFTKLGYSGSEYFDHTHAYALDLDAVGDKSLFMLYNISESVFGREKFASRLLAADRISTTADEIHERRETVRILEDKIDFLEEYQACERRGKLDKAPGALLELASKEKPLSSGLKILYKADPILWIIPLVFLAFSMTVWAKISALAIIAVNLLIMFLVPTEYDGFFKTGRIIERQASALAELFELSEKEGFTSGFTENLKQLSKACFFMSLRSQPLFALVLNIIMPFDLLCADKLSKWSSNNGSNLKNGIDELAELECLMSTAVVGIVSDSVCEPEILEYQGKAVISGTNMRHPLIEAARAVGNSVTLEGQRALITGSNMSGKTTLIRTCGVLTILSFMGASVPADSFKVTVMRIASSMRIVDSIEENMSTFKAELIRIGKIISSSKEDGPMLFLIDEIFRGTNSTDRTEGALTVLRNLSEPRIIGFMTTHDYALCDRTQEEMKDILYYHFSESYNDTGISFDYKLASGVSHVSNARFLMKLVGIE